MIPKPKKDSKDPSSYRPISLLSNIGKLFERVLATRMDLHLRESDFFNQWQRAYLKKKEAAEHIYRLGEEIKLAKGRGLITTAVSLDVEKAFDSVWHDGLRYKLAHMGLPTKLVRLLSSFLTDRSIKVRAMDELSAPVTLNAGTPQGSVLSPLLFNIYVNDVPINPRNQCSAGQFADDLSMWSTSGTRNINYIRIQRALDDIERWCSTWRIKINVGKTQLTTFSKTRDKVRKVKRVTNKFDNKPLTLFGQVITEKKKMTLLGVTFDQNLSYVHHCKEKAIEASRRLNMLRMLRGKNWGANSRTLLTLYKQYIRPIVDYGNVVTANAPKTSLGLLQRVQNAALRTALNTERRTRIKTLHRLGRIQPIAKRLKSLREKAIGRFGDSHLMKEMTILQHALQL